MVPVTITELLTICNIFVMVSGTINRIENDKAYNKTPSYS
jgi:hypothetical protein